MSDAAKTIGPYEVVELVSKGSTGRVYKAVDKTSNRPVTVKVLPRQLAEDAEALERFRNETEAVSKLNHPNVARVVDHGEDEGRAYYVMEHVPAGRLDQLLKKRRLSLPEAFAIFKGVARGLEEAHEKDIVHGNLSPRTILVSNDLSTIKLTDFGIGRSAAESGKSGTLTSTSVTTRTLHYLAPEQAAGMSQADERADIYSLGVLLYEMLTGRVPIGSFNLPSRVNSEVPADVDPVVLRCLEREPSARYASVSVLLRENDRLEDQLRLGLVSELRGIGRTFSRPTTQIFKHRRVLMLGVLAVGAIAALGLGAWSWVNREPRQAAVVVAAERPVTGRPVTERPATAERPESSLAAALDDIEPLEESAVVAQEPTVEETPEAEPVAEEEVETVGEESAAEGEAASQPAPSPVSDARKAYELAAEMARNGLLDQSLVRLDDLLERSPSSAVATDALFLRARIEETLERFEDAMATYTEIGTLYDDAELRSKARYRFARLALESDLPNGEQLALGVFDEIPRAYPATDYAPLALASKAAIEAAGNVRVDSEEFGRRVPASFLTSIDLVERYPDSPAAERAFWIVGTEYEDLKLWDRAAEAFWQLAARFPDTELDAWWKAGQILDRRLEDTGRAVEAYRRVPGSSPHSDDAQKRISKLTR